MPLQTNDAWGFVIWAVGICISREGKGLRVLESRIGG